MLIKIALSANFGNIAERGKIIRCGIGPAGGQLMQEPISVQRLYILCNALQAVL